MVALAGNSVEGRDHPRAFLEHPSRNGSLFLPIQLYDRAGSKKHAPVWWKLRKATLTRLQTGDEGSFGTLVTDSGFKCVTGELPWRDNQTGKSCIPPGVYVVTYRFSPKHNKMCYHVENVPDRTDIEIHSANLMGDVSLGFECQLLGCIAPGKGIGQIAGQKAVIASRITLAALEADLAQETFELTIV